MPIPDIFFPGKLYKFGCGIDVRTPYLCHAVGHQSITLPNGMSPAIIAPYDGANFPHLQIIEEFTAGNADCAHEHFIDFVGGYTFFASFAFSSSVASGTCCSAMSGIS